MHPVFEALLLAAGIVVFLAGISVFYKCLEKTSENFRGFFEKVGDNRFACLAIGAGATATVQSSSAITVMVIGLVNAGILTLFQSAAIIMGTNIGTTVTGFLFALRGFKIKYFFMGLAPLGAFLELFAKKNGTEKIADFLIGLGVMFIGLELMSGAFSADGSLSNAFARLFENTLFPPLLILLGAVFTAIIQSSSASCGIYIILLGRGVIPLPSALYLMLGSETGTCVTSLLASAAANTNAKRAALTHLLFNIISVIVFGGIVWICGNFLLPVYARHISSGWQLPLFQVIVNIGTTVLLIWFIKPLNRLVCILIKDKPVKN